MVGTESSTSGRRDISSRRGLTWRDADRPAHSIAARSGILGALLFNALGHVARDGNGAAHRAAGLSPDEGKCHFDVESAPGLVRRTG